MRRWLAGLEWPTLWLLAACYAAWGASLWWLPGLSLWLAIPVAGWAIAQHASLTHEAIHGHPFRSPLANALAVAPPLALVIPYMRFRDSHLAHHRDADLTDPYDDPESNFMAEGVWRRLPGVARSVLRFNNTLIGRMIVGPVIGQAAWMASDWRASRSGDWRVARGWLWHAPALALVLWAVSHAAMPMWGYAAACYLGLSLLKIRTFLEHQAHERARGRTVIIEDRGPLALLFLNNNLHVVHHAHPRVAWYNLPALYEANRDRYLGMNGGYRYRSYAEVFARYLWRAKDPVAHPILRRSP